VHMTGASGFLGGYVARHLIAGGHAVSALARSEVAAARVAELGATPVPGDLDDPRSLDDTFAASGANALVNVASLGFGHAPAIVAAAEEAGLKRAVFVSTTAVFTSLNASSKSIRLAAEECIRNSDLHWTIVRPTMIYGTPADRNMTRLLRLVRRCPLLPLPGGGRQLHQPVHVDDVAAAIAAAVELPRAIGHTYNVAGPRALTLRELINTVGSAVGRSPRYITVPLAPTAAVAAAYERLARHPRITAEQIRRLGEDKAFDINPARQDLRFRPREFATGIKEQAHMQKDR
jgi:uncharacterized protein YbjT (DUF2867 family)